MFPTIDFLNYKFIVQYLLLFAAVMLCGWAAKDVAALLITGIIIYYCINRNVFGALSLWLIWFFTQGFYVGQGFLTNQVILKYATKPSFVLFIIFIFFISTIPDALKKRPFILVWLGFTLIAFLSSLGHGQLPFIIITASSFFILYLLLTSRDITPVQYQRFLNLFVAVAILQTLVSVLQVLQIIPAATKAMSDGNGGVDVWQAALDDAASGTFGADTSHLVSWYASMIALFTIIVWVKTKKNKYLLVAIISIMQFATVDSKTVMVVMCLMMLYLLYYMFRNREKFGVDASKLFKIILTIIALGVTLFVSWNMYYQYANGQYGSGDRANLHSVYKNEVSTSFDAITEHWTEWGKIQGFRYEFEDFSPLEIIGGYGLQGYDNTKMNYIASQDTPLMQLDDSTRSISGLISMFGTSGVVGFILIMISLISWYRFNLQFKSYNPVMVVNVAMISIFSVFSVLLAFLYIFDISSIPIISFAGLIAVLQRYSEADKLHYHVFSQLIKNKEEATA